MGKLPTRETLMRHTMPLEGIDKSFDRMERGESIRGFCCFDVAGDAK